MGQNKVESQIKEKLNSREIQPSAQAWDRLDAMLSVSEEKKTKPSFGWLYIAASILVFATLGMFLFTQKGKVIQPQNDVVNTEIKNDTLQNQTNTNQKPVIVQKQENQVAVATENKSTIKNQRVSINNQKTTSNQKQSNPSINHDKQIEFQNSSDVAVKDLPKIENKKDPSYSEQANQISNNDNKSDDFLLAGLDKTAKQSANKKSEIKVDAKSLLSQVDGELELTFREKVINSVSKNYQEIKVALANRNQE